jgi:hypothetical protein
MGNPADMMANNVGKLSPEVAAERLGQVRGYSTLDRNADGTMVEWDIKKEARETPTPEAVRTGINNWGDAATHYEGRKVVIFGAGSSTLKQELGLLNGELVYGINWTYKWFAPTFLQCFDQKPMMSLLECKDLPPDFHRRTLLVHGESRQALVDKRFAEGPNTMQTLPIRTSTNAVGPSEEPGGVVPHGPNSLIMALGAVSWLKPERIVLVGFDFGGAHFWGDGRTEGAICHYGLSGSLKANAVPKLRALRDDLMITKGVPIVQVGETELDVFPGLDSLEDALYTDREAFLWQ